MRAAANVIAFYFVGYWAFVLAANICCKEGGTDPGHRLMYFILGNALGISSNWFLVRIYARMNVNLAMLLAVGGGFVILQVVLLLVYHTQLTSLQCAGILIAIAGMVITLWPRRPTGDELPIQDATSTPPQKVTT